MIRRARVVTPTEGVTRATLVVPVIVDGGEAFVDRAVPDELGDQVLPRQFDAAWCRRQGLSDQPGASVTLVAATGRRVVLVVVGSTLTDLDHYRLAGAAAVRQAQDDDVAFFLPTGALERAGDVAQAIVEGALLASYRFKETSGESSFDLVPLGSPLPTVAVHDDVSEGVRRATIVAESVNWAKRLIDTPAGALTPRDFADQALARLERSPHVTVEVWNESRSQREGLGGLLGVGQGSAQPTRLVYATYEPPGRTVAHVALVGKGVTFDSGGLSLKPPDAMTTMKTDMTGAAVVLAVLDAVSAMGVGVRVSVIAPMVENLPGGRALKPGDVITVRGGTTVEVLNTDAEGRLILADGLVLAAEANPDAIIDVATLTGAQRVALGDRVGAYFASTEDIAAGLARAAARSGEPLWRLPLVDAYEADLDSDVAALKNIGKPGKAGAVVAALFLRRFVGDRPWVHLDIAGPGRAESEYGYVTRGGTAFSARTIIEFLRGVAASASD